jgi:hypothetical protein
MLLVNLFIESLLERKELIEDDFLTHWPIP